MMSSKEKEKESPQSEETVAGEQTPESTASAGEAATAKEEQPNLASQLEDRLLRLQADFDNYRKRIAREKEDAVRYANESLLEELLPVIDNFDLGMMAAEKASDAKSILMGLQMVQSQFKRFLEEHGVQEINAASGAFDPHQHEAVSQEAAEGVEEGHIVSQRRKGYKLRDRLIRPAMVVVAKASSGEEPKAE